MVPLIPKFPSMLPFAIDIILLPKNIQGSVVTIGSIGIIGYFLNEFSEPITLTEVKTGTKTLKNSTSVGYDCISNAMLIYSSSSMIESNCKL